MFKLNSKARSHITFFLKKQNKTEVTLQFSHLMLIYLVHSETRDNLVTILAKQELLLFFTIQNLLSKISNRPRQFF